MQTFWFSTSIRRAACALSLAGMLGSGAPAGLAQQQATASKKDAGLYTFKANAELVLVSVTARDRKGNIHGS